MCIAGLDACREHRDARLGPVRPTTGTRRVVGAGEAGTTHHPCAARGAAGILQTGGTLDGS